jgi:hypothetical protein
MKLRLKDNSIRIRLLRSEVDALAGTGRIEAHTLLSPTDQGERLSYAIEHADRYRTISVTRVDGELRVTAPSREILDWAKSEQVGIYGEQVVFGGATLTVAVEKDFACIDRSDADNSDTFENPNGPQC